MLKDLTTEELRHVVDYLSMMDLARLKLVGDGALWARLTHERVMRRMWTDKKLPFVQAFALLAPAVFRSLHIESTKPMIVKNSGHTWVHLLPSTLEELDFDFPGAWSLFLRFATPGESHFSFMSNNHPYVPVELDRLLPNLTKLRLMGSIRSTAGDEYLNAGELSFHKFHLFDRFPEYNSQEMKPKLPWKVGMMAYFIKHLPRSLTFLEMPYRLSFEEEEEGVLPEPFAFDFPPSLTRLTWNRRDQAHRHYHMREILPFIEHATPSPLYNTLIKMQWPFSFGSIPTLLPRFQHLQTLSMWNTEFNGSYFHLLPRTLTSLRITGEAGFTATSLSAHFGNQDLPKLPLGLVKLYIRYPSDDIDFSLLPRNLRKLCLEGNRRMSWTVEERLATLGASLPHLNTFRLWSIGNSTISSLAWVPLATMRELDLRLSNFPNNLLETWPKDQGPNNIHTLTLLSDGPTKFTDKLAKQLPPNLTHLTFAEPLSKLFFTPRGFLGSCPRTLQHIAIIRHEKNRFGQNTLPPSPWKDDEILPLSPEFCKSRNLAAPNISIPPALNYFTTPIQHVGRLLGPVTKSFGESGFRKLRCKPENAVLKNCDPVAPSQGALAPFIFGAHLTKIRMPIVITFTSPIWKLQNLETLTVAGLALGEKEIAKLQPLRTLTTLHVLEHPVAQAWFNRTSAHLTSLTELNCELSAAKVPAPVADFMYHSKDPIEVAANMATRAAALKSRDAKNASELAFATFAKLTNLKTLTIRIENTHDPEDPGAVTENVKFVTELFRSIPNSVTKLKTEQLPDSFYKFSGADENEKRRLEHLEFTGPVLRADAQTCPLPHLKTLKARCVNFVSMARFMAGLPRDLKEVTFSIYETVQLALLQSVFPCLERAELFNNGMGASILSLDFVEEFTENPALEFYLSEAPAEELAALSLAEQQDPNNAAEDPHNAALAYKSYSDLTTGAAVRKAKEAIKFQAAFLRALPPALTSLTCRFFSSPLSSLLPRTLLTLDIRDSVALAHHKTHPLSIDWPPQLTELAFAVNRAHSLGAAFYGALPRSITRLEIQRDANGGRFQDDELQAFPPQLRMFKALDFTFGENFLLLPLKHLTYLAVGSLMVPDALDALPDSLTELIISLPYLQETVDQIYKFGRFQQKHFVIFFHPSMSDTDEHVAELEKKMSQALSNIIQVWPNRILSAPNM